MLDRIRSDFQRQDRTTMVILGLAMVVTGGLTASGASDVGIGLWLGAATAVGGVLMLAGTAVWGTDKQSQ